MKSKLKISLFFALITLFVCSVSAQRPSSSSPRTIDPERMTEREVKDMKETLSLNAEQEKKIEKICLKYNKQIKEESEKAAGNRETLRTEMRKINEAKNAEIKEVLTPEQIKKWEDKQKERERERGQNRRGGRGQNN